MTDQTEMPDGMVDDAALFEQIANAEPAKAAEMPADTDDAPNLTTPAPPPIEEPAKPAAQPEERNPLYGAMKEEREKRQNAERELADYRARVALFEQQAAMMRQPQAPQPAPDIFENPEAFVQTQFQPAMDMQRQALMYNAKLIAEARFTEETVAAAQEAFDSLVKQGSIHPAEAQQVLSSPNPFAEAVKWHQRHKVVSEVGTDPTAYREKLLEQALNDPEFRKRADALWRSQAGAPAAVPQARAPVINLPSLSKVGSAALTSPADEMPDDASLFNATVSRRRR